ncbi:porin [Bradyrhizobium sp. th.b2]|uniref:porin n=1 Tax=Bradyrhizobium sp. th-b2 TaxID=172088 RepID=UPI0009FBD8E9|nr:porin [Bradyrhizobium sp. th.b2]
MKSVIVAMACVICFGSTVNAVAAEDKDATTQEIEMLRREMQQMKASQKALQSKLDALAAAPRLSVAARGTNTEVPKKVPQSPWPAGVQIPAPPNTTSPDIAEVPQVARISQTGIVRGPAPVLGNTLSTRVWGVDVGLYGFLDLSFDRANNGVKSINQVSSNESFLGVAGGIDLGSPYWRAIYQIETMAEVSATPGVASSIGSRNSFVGIDTPIGRFMAGKDDTPYKRSTALMNPFKGSVGDYNSIMGNSAGEGRTEFDYRMPHSVFFDSHEFYGFTVNALYSPGQKLDDLAAAGNNAFPVGELVCSGSQQPSLNGATPNAQGTQTLCNDGAFKDAYSVAVNYSYGPLYLTAAYELHKDVNRESDKGGVIADEAAAKVGASYHLPFNNQVSVIYEELYRYGVVAATNERQRSGLYVSDVQDIGFGIDLMAGYAHAGQTPGSPKFPGLDDRANMYSVGAKYHWNEHTSL